MPPVEHGQKLNSMKWDSAQCTPYLTSVLTTEG